jgi:hypothetical protein
MKNNPRAGDFLRNMSVVPAAAPDATPPMTSVSVPITHREPANDKPIKKKRRPSGARGKHIGGYIDDEGVLEKFAVLQARLKLDNSDLIKLMVEETYARNITQRAFK